MATIPPYVPPFVDAAGLHINTYQSILNDNLQAFLNIFGSNQYIAPDSAIYQLLSILSLKQSDCNLGLQLAYNQSGPSTAVGAGLDRVVKLNGLARAPFTYSSVVLTLTGTPGTVLANCFAQDGQGNLWAIPSGTTFVTGTLNVTAICTTPGNVTAEPGTVTIIATPTVGWASVTNAAAAVAGKPVETDSQLRARQAISVARPSLTTLQSTIADVLAVSGVTRINPGTLTPPSGPGTSIENPTGSIDSWGNPPHSISMVVEGGTDLAVATAIYGARGIGCFTNGTTTVPIVDPNSGYTMDISFFRPTYLPIFLLAHLTSYGAAITTAIINAVQSALVTYLNSLQIGETVSISALIYEAMSVNTSLGQPTFGVSLTIGTLTAATTATVTMSSNVIAVASATGIIIGQLVVGAGIPVGTTVSGIAGTNITLSHPATAGGTGVPVEFSTLSAVDIPMPGYIDVAEGLAANVSVVTP